MGELIERSAALKAIGAYDYRWFTVEQVRTITDGCKEVVAALPAVDAVPVVHSKWKMVGADKSGRGGTFVCLARDKCYPFTCDYCPNCGAKMDLEEQ